jgi:hypothetical protein
MPTWHQERRPVRWWHATKWTLAEGTRSGEFLGFTLCDTRDEALRLARGYRANGKTFGLAIVPPANRPDAKYEVID